MILSIKTFRVEWLLDWYKAITWLADANQVALFRGGVVSLIYNVMSFDDVVTLLT